VTGILYDSVDVTQIPAGAEAVAGYTTGLYPTWASLCAKFPNAQRLSIAIAASHDADTLDVETGDAAVADAPGWVRRQHRPRSHPPLPVRERVRHGQPHLDD